MKIFLYITHECPPIFIFIFFIYLFFLTMRTQSKQRMMSIFHARRGKHSIGGPSMIVEGQKIISSAIAAVTLIRCLKISPDTIPSG